MKQFMDKDFILETETAKHLFHDYAEKMPIIDYHCHLVPQEIYEDKNYNNITEVWLGGDHYKWRLMRSCGIDEKYITGDASDKEKFFKWAGCLSRAIGNPLYHWSHLELQRYFGYNGILNEDTAEEVWNLCNAKLAEKNMSVRGLILQSNVDVICTTDDPIDSLEWHEKIAADGFAVKVLPAWRPDTVWSKDEKVRAAYLEKLSAVSGVKITDNESLKKALMVRMDFFEAHGCKVADHGLVDVPAHDEIQEFLAGEYARRGWIMQLHYGAIRNLNTKMFNSIGANTGYDAITNETSASNLASFLDAVESKSGLPKTIIYSLNPTDNAYIGSIIGAFQGTEAAGKIQHGSAWWFNDNKLGMEEQMKSLANLGCLGNFVGMLTDSRSFISYTRHEYFRRIMCNLIGNWVENGEYPADEKALKDIVCGISYDNAKKYFGF